jgi:hypothetical protein
MPMPPLEEISNIEAIGQVLYTDMSISSSRRAHPAGGHGGRHRAHSAPKAKASNGRTSTFNSAHAGRRH